MMLVAVIVCPATTPTSETIRMTSMARSRDAGVFASTSAGLGNSAATALPRRPVAAVLARGRLRAGMPQI
jgi:hypothetical protein